MPLQESEIRQLPAWEIAPEVNRQLAAHGSLVVTAPPGAGKSTVLPLTLLSSLPAGARILMLEPRRIAARQIAVRMASLLGETVGETVGYRIRFERKVSGRTRIEVLTEGILTRMLVEDPTLEGVAVVIFDEFHERSIQTDLALALSREVQGVLRPDLKLVIMSATIDVEALCSALQAPRVSCSGKRFPVEIHYGGDVLVEEIVPAIVRLVRTALQEREGDMLVFLPGEGEIRRCAEALGQLDAHTRICPLFGLLPMEAQRRAIAPSPPGERKVVLATPIAETSLTIEGVRIVVDAGLCRKPVFDSRTALEHLETVRISRDMMTQRTGRAGRVAPGCCWRLWSPAAETRMAERRMPEILEADLAPLALQIAAAGESRPERLPWLTPPPAPALRSAHTLLQSLGAVKTDGQITPYGRKMAALPCHPRMAQMLLAAEDDRLQALAADVAALLEEKDPLAAGMDAGIDLRINALRNARRSGRAGPWSQLARIATQYRDMVGAAEDSGPVSPYDIGALVSAAYPERIAKAWKEGHGRYCLASGDLVSLDGDSVLAGAEWLAVASVHTRSGGVGRIFLAAPVAESDLRARAVERDHVFWDSKAGAVLARREWRIGCHLLAASPLPEGYREEALRVLCEAAKKEGRSMFDFSPEVENLQRRVAAVAAWHPELDLPDLSTESVLETASGWLPLYAGKATSSAQLRKIDLCAVLWGLLPYDCQQAVSRLAPTHVIVPTGSNIRLEYRPGAQVPVLRVRLQECFGLLDTPCVDDGRRPVLMELLSPGYKPVQLTSDLRSFWSGAYFEVRKELRRRYPKHAWPDDPLAARPVRGVKK
ncbi:MAG: ATP-dependent helicase HrpB [Bacteroidales bacterium]|nr:ATP-dependent helicase HrpB [Bacteroidales bacterium]